uniref:Uncharacterized protein n=1 Tax=Rhizophora mucronata TaxID=61149 RepID=A0A2P2QAV3_RHIMU
MRSQMTTS